MNQGVKAIIGIAVISSLVFGFMELKESQKEETKSSADLIASALSKKGIFVEEILITTGSEASKAFDAEILGSKIALVMFRIPGGGAEEKLKEYVTAVYTTFDADPTLEGVMAFDVNFAETSGTALIIYANRTSAERLRNSNLAPEEILNEWRLIEYARLQK